MSELHVTQEELEDFVGGSLRGERADAFEAHVAECSTCGAKLAREARLEEALYEVRGALAGEPRLLRPRFRRAAVVAIIGAVATAAAIALSLPRPAPVEVAPAPPPMARPSAIPVVVCVDLLDQAACIERAHRRGLYVAHPDGAGAPPLGGSAGAIGPSSSPFPVSQRSEPK